MGFPPAFHTTILRHIACSWGEQWRDRYLKWVEPTRVIDKENRQQREPRLAVIRRIDQPFELRCPFLRGHNIVDAFDKRRGDGRIIVDGFVVLRCRSPLVEMLEPTGRQKKWRLSKRGVLSTAGK